MIKINEIYKKEKVGDCNFAVTIKPIFDEYVYLPENKNILEKLQKAFLYDKLHITLCITFLEYQKILKEVALDFLSCGKIDFCIKSIDKRDNKIDNDIQSFMLWLSLNNDNANQIISHVRNSSLRGLQKSEFRKQNKYPEDNYHLLLKVKSDTVEYLKYIKSIEAKTIFLKELGHDTEKTFEFQLNN